MANEKRLIDANALIQQFSGGETMKTMTQSIYDAMFVKALQEAPTVDAVEVVYADWINITQLDGKRFVGFCSHCGTEQVVKFPTALKAYHKHCRWCGAKMDGDRNG